jgi:hypothetical protein
MPRSISGCSTRRAGKPLRDDDDPYDLADWPRKQVKIAMLIAINAPTEIGAIRAIALHVFGAPYKAETAKARALLRAIKAKHVDIAHAFGSDAGARLMRKDSDITEQIMLDMIQQGVVPLSIHDSYIVSADQAGKLEEAMERELRRNDPDSATSYLHEIPKETPEMYLQYGEVVGPDGTLFVVVDRRGSVVKVSDSVRQWRHRSVGRSAPRIVVESDGKA